MNRFWTLKYWRLAFDCCSDYECDMNSCLLCDATWKCRTGLASFVPQGGHIILNDSPEVRTCLVYTYIGKKKNWFAVLCFKINELRVPRYYLWGTGVAQWLRCCATNRKVAGSIPAGVTAFLSDIKSFRSHYGLGVDLASKRNEY